MISGIPQILTQNLHELVFLIYALAPKAAWSSEKSKLPSKNKLSSVDGYS